MVALIDYDVTVLGNEIGDGGARRAEHVAQPPVTPRDVYEEVATPAALPRLRGMG